MISLVKPAWQRYGFAVLCIAAAAIARWILLRWFGGAYHMVPTLMAAMVAAWYGGFGPSLLVAFAGVMVAGLMPQLPRQSGPYPWLGLATYLGLCLGIALLGGWIVRARRRIDEQLHDLVRQREQLAATLQSIGDAVIVTDADSLVVSLNPVAENLTGWTTEEAAGQPLGKIFRIVQEETRDTVECPVRRVVRDGSIVGLANHTLLIARDGGERSIDDSAAPIRDASGRLAGVVLVFRDVAERRQMERQRQEEARRKDEFLALLAHELRNPLAPINSALDVLKVAADDAESCREAREVAQRQVRHLTRLVDDLLDVSRIMRGKVELRKEPVELSSAVARAVETVQPAIDADGHELVVNLPDEPIWLEADPVRLAQVLSNLLSNAAKYTEKRGRIELSAEASGDEVAICVQDNGIGVAPELVPRLFEMFMQVAPGATRSQGGLGIGLTLAKNLVEMHGGKVAAHSDGVGRGCKFTVRLPTTVPGREDETEPDEPPMSPQRRVLVVDDNRDAAQSLAMLLKLRGHDVQVAFGGEEAIACVRSAAPELVFLDIGMPGMDGYQVAKALRAEFDPSLELVALTGWGTDQDRRRSQEAGFDKHLTKPVKLADLDRVLAGGHRGAERAQEPIAGPTA